jgi:hypothetical protein
MRPKLKPPGTQRLRLENDGLLPNFGFKSNLRRYNLVGEAITIADVIGAQAGPHTPSPVSQLSWLWVFS